MTTEETVMHGETEDPRVSLLLSRLKATPNIPETKKLELAGELKFALEINGDPNPICQTNKRMLISGVDREMQAYERHAAIKNDLAAIVKSALDEHAKNCVFVLMKARAEEEAKRRVKAEEETAVEAAAAAAAAAAQAEAGRSSIRIGKLLEAKGGAAVVVSVVAAFAIVVIGWVSWQNGKTRDLIKQSMNTAVQEALSAQ